MYTLQQEYRELSNQLSAYVVKLLDRVRTQDELELVLNKAGKPNEEKYSSLARLRLALQYGEKKVNNQDYFIFKYELSWNLFCWIILLLCKWHFIKKS